MLEIAQNNLNIPRYILKFNSDLVGLDNYEQHWIIKKGCKDS